MDHHTAETSVDSPSDEYTKYEYVGPSISTMFKDLLLFIENYGWYLLILGVVLVYIYNSKLKSYVEKWKQQREEAEYSAKYHKNPDLLQAHLTAQQRYAEQLQEKYRRDAEEFKRKQEEKEAKKREELLSKLDGVTGTRLGSANDTKSKKSFKPEYNPLMGSGSSSNYRPPKRSKCGGGGCGR